MDNLHEHLTWKNGRTLTYSRYMQSLRTPVVAEANTPATLADLVQLHPTGARLIKRQQLRVTVQEQLADHATVDRADLRRVQSRLVQVVPLPARSFAAQRLAQLLED